MMRGAAAGSSSVNVGAREMGRGMSAVVIQSEESVSRQGVQDGRRKVTSHEDDDMVVERTTGVERVSGEGGGRVADVDMVLISLDHEEDDKRGSCGLSGHSVLANCLIGERCSTNDTLQGSVIRHRHSPSRRVREMVRSTGGGHSWGSVLSFGRS